MMVKHTSFDHHTVIVTALTLSVCCNKGQLTAQTSIMFLTFHSSFFPSVYLYPSWSKIHGLITVPPASIIHSTLLLCHLWLQTTSVTYGIWHKSNICVYQCNYICDPWNLRSHYLTPLFYNCIIMCILRDDNTR